MSIDSTNSYPVMPPPEPLTKLKILGKTYKIDCRNEDTSIIDDVYGKTLCSCQTIIINKRNTSDERNNSTLLHEIIEVINYEMNLKLNHATINRLEMALYQVLTENNLWNPPL